MRDLIQKWLRKKTKNPQDDERFYDIVIKSLKEKVEIQDFKDVNHSLGDFYDVEELYKRYEDLYCFMIYIKQNNIVL